MGISQLSSRQATPVLLALALSLASGLTAQTLAPPPPAPSAPAEIPVPLLQNATMPPSAAPAREADSRQSASSAVTGAPAAGAASTVGAPAGLLVRVYIPVGNPNVKKVLLAVEPTMGGASAAREFADTLRNDLDFSDLFDFLKSEKFPKDTSTSTPGTFNIDPFRTLGVDFLLKTSVTTKGSQVEAEAHLYDVKKGVSILSRRYPFVSKAAQPARELAHYVGKEIGLALTQVLGIFRTRIIMSCGHKTKEIYVMDFDGQNIKQLTRDRNFALSPSWAPDGKRMLFTSFKPAVRGGPLNPNLYLFDFSTGARKVLSAARGLNTGGVFHPRENKIAYTFSRNGHPEIYILDLDTNSRRGITDTKFFTVEPSFSPDGTRLAYSSTQFGVPHIIVANGNGSGPKRLTFAGVYNSSPTWSPSGDRIVFSGQETPAAGATGANVKNNFNIFTIDPAGSSLIRLTDGEHSSENPSFSPDGRFIVFSSNQGGTYRVSVMTAKGSRIRALTPTSLGHCKQPSWSPRL